MTFRYDPFEQMNRLFEQTRQSVWDGVDTNVSVEQTDEGYVVMADLPGYDREHIDVRVSDGRLTIRAERDTEREDADRRYLQRERRSESVPRSIELPASVDESDATATYQHGVLTVTIPRASEEVDGGHRIDVN